MTGILQALLMGYGGAAAAATDADFEYVTLLLPGNGTNGAQNNTFLDSSSNNFTITRNGNTTQGTFTPYGDNWSNYFDGTGDYLNTASNTWTQLSTGNFTVEGWAYINSYGTYFALVDARSSPSFSPWIFGVNSSGYADFFYGTTSGDRITDNVAVGLNTWVHLAAVRNGSTITLYVNGVSKATATYSSSINGGSSTPSIGRLVDPVSANGYISNLRVVIGTAVYTAAFTPPTAPLTAVTNTQLLTCQSNRFIDNSTNAFAITVNGDVSAQRFSPFSPTAAYASGTIGGSGFFDGTGDYLTVADNASLEFGSSNFTFEYWIYQQSTSDSTPYWKGSSGQYSPFAILMSSSALTVYMSYAGAAWDATITSSIVPRLSAWNHIAVVRNGSTVTLYVNGVSSGTANVSTNSLVNTSASIGIGAPNTGGAYQLQGYLSNYRIVIGSAVYTANFTPPTSPVTAITNTQLLLNYTNAGIIDNAMMNDLETVGNAQISTTQSKFGGGSMYFDGTGDWLVGNFASKDLYSFGTGNFMFEMWVYTSNLSNYQTLLDTRASDSQIAWCLFIDNTGKPYWYDASGVQLSSTAISSNTWTHLAIARSGSTLKMFLGGTEVFSGTNTNSQNPTGTFYVGRNAVNAFLYTGYIDDLRITKGVARYTANFTAPTAAFPTS